MTANGELDESTLVPVEGTMLAAAPTASAFADWQRFLLENHHVELHVAGPAGAYRSRWVQADMKANPGDYNLNALSAAKLADPGLSRHGQGRALDISDASAPSAFRDLVRSTAGAFGFVLWTTKDPNHFEHGDDPVHTTEEDDMGLTADDRAWIASVVQRESRRRLYQDTDTGRFYSIDWDLPTGDPAKIAYPRPEQIVSLHVNYQVRGDVVDPAKQIDQAKKLNHAAIQTLLAIADGTDAIFRPENADPPAAPAAPGDPLAVADPIEPGE